MVVALAAMAAAALVQAMVTDGWEGVRHKVARLFGRGQPDAAIERRLDSSRDQLTAATPSELETVQATLAAQWETRFADDDLPIIRMRRRNWPRWLRTSSQPRPPRITRWPRAGT